jgi:hypothetical protein
VATARKPARRPATGQTPGAGRREHWWPGAVAIIVAAGLHTALPTRYRVQPVRAVPVALPAPPALIAPVSRAVQPGPAGHTGSGRSRRPRVPHCSGSYHLRVSEDSGAVVPGEPADPPSALSTMGWSRDGRIPGIRPGESRLPTGRSADRAPDPRFPGPAIGLTQHQLAWPRAGVRRQCPGPGDKAGAGAYDDDG